jgi:hypothetical protein
MGASGRAILMMEIDYRIYKLRKGGQIAPKTAEIGIQRPVRIDICGRLGLETARVRDGCGRFQDQSIHLRDLGLSNTAFRNHRDSQDESP